MKMQFHKAVVKVLVVVAPDRTKTPVSLTFEDGKEYSIDRVCLFEDEDQWFVEAKNLHV